MKTRKRFCVNGHDRAVVGVDKWRACRACRKAKRSVPRSDYGFERPVCVNGHDKRILGARKNGACAECHRIRDREWRRRRSEEHRRSNPDARANGRHMPNLPSVRRYYGMSQSQFAEEARVSVSVLAKIEQGRNRARPPVLRAILGTVARLMREERA